MKNSLDPRHQKRRSLVTDLFAGSFPGQTQNQSIAHIIPLLPQIDAEITAAAPEWPITQIAKVDLAILRLAVFELHYDTSEPPKVVIDEAVELAKEFGNEQSGSFVNGVLGTIIKKRN